jgi:hypothetical protein
VMLQFFFLRNKKLYIEKREREKLGHDESIFIHCFVLLFFLRNSLLCVMGQVIIIDLEYQFSS